MGSTAWAAAMMGTLAVVLVLAFVGVWLRDKDRADEVASDAERSDPDRPRDTHPSTTPGPD